MKKFLSTLLLVSIIASSFSFSWAVETYKTLDKIVADDSGVLVTLSGKTKYHAFKISNPARVVVEFSNTLFNVKEKEITGTGDIIKRVRGGQFKDSPTKIARIVVDLNKMVDYQVKHEGDNDRLIFAEKPADTANKAPVSGVEPVQPETAKAIDVSKSDNTAVIESSAAANNLKTDESIKPVIETTKPEAETVKPVAEEAVKPVAEEAVKPVSEPVKPVAEEDIKPAEKKVKHAAKKVNPAVESANPAAEAAKPVVNEQPAAIVSAPVKAPTTEETSIVIAQPVSEKDAANLNIGSAKSFKADTEKEKPLIDAKAESKPTAKPTIKPNASIAKKPLQQKVKSTAAPVNQHVTMSKKLITIDFDDADIREVFRILSMKSGINIIYGNDVTGTITLRLENVPFDKAFQTILSLKNLVSDEMGNNIIRVASPAQITLERAHAVTFTKVFPLNYAKADDIKSNLDSVRTAEGRQGTISVDQRTNTLIITDTPDGLISLEKIIAELDTKPVQVLIEAKIVEVVLNKDFDLGIQWQSAQSIQNGANQIAIGASQAQTSGIVMGNSATVGATVVGPVNTLNGGTGVNFGATPVNGEIGQIAFGIFSNQASITGTLSALAKKGLSKLLSNPKVTTINNKEAKILVGQRIPYTTTTVSTSGSTQSTNFLDVGVKLTVTPTINADQKITLAVHPEVSLYVRADPAGPVIGTREANTTVIVNSGETVVIGGLITEQDIKSGEGVPLLEDLPVIGFLFKHQSSSKERDELLVFLTPQIIE